MSQENVENLRLAFDAFKRRDTAAWRALCDPELEDVPPRDWPESDPTRGCAAVWDLYVENTEPWREGALEPVELIEVGDDKVVAHAQGEMHGQASGAAVEWSYWQVVTFRNGKAWRIEWFVDRAEALEAVGLREMAMSQENVEVVRRASEVILGVGRGDPGALFDESVRQGIVASNLEWSAGPRGGVGVAGLEDGVGRAGYVDFMRRWTEDFDDYGVEPEEIIDADNNRVVVITRQYGTGKGSGMPVEIRTGAVLTLEAGCITRVDLFLEPNDALKAVGLRE
jgi:ketosteroid isomerase-like protein